MRSYRNDSALWTSHFITLFGFTDTVCLEMLGITGPRSVNVGDDLTLTCRYDLGRDAIYRLVLKCQYIYFLRLFVC